VPIPERNEAIDMNIIFDADRFYVGPDPQNPLAEITFLRKGNKRLVIDHTFTDPSLRGQGIARKLVDTVVAYARENGLKLLATCPYARKVLSEPEYEGVYVGQKDNLL
jgi:predicted GNAT family acetyltransferase